MLNCNINTVRQCMDRVRDPLAAAFLLSIYARLTSEHAMRNCDAAFIRNIGRQHDDEGDPPVRSLQ
jgi:hypothetical protein